MVGEAPGASCARLRTRVCHCECTDGGTRAQLGSGLGFGLWLGSETVKRQPDAIPLSGCPNDQSALELGFLGVRLIPNHRSGVLVAAGFLGA
eukprot:9613457-Heterocapsa_arctica.AAC.1